jgi:hypothetical protein
LPNPSHWYPHPKKTCFTCLYLNILKCILVIQGGFVPALQTCMYHLLIRLTPPIFLYHLGQPSFISLQCITLYYIHI